MLRHDVRSFCSVLLLLVLLATSGCQGSISDPSQTAPSPGPTSNSSSPGTASLLPAAPWFITDDSTLTSSQMASLFDTQQLYFRVSNPNNASGNISGGIVPSGVSYQTDAGDPFAANPANAPVTFSALLGGDQVRPRNVVSSASAYGSVTLDPSSKSISGFIVSSGIIGVRAEVRDGFPGTAGDVVVVLEGGPVVWRVPSGTLLNDAQLSRLKSGAYYFSVSSTEFPNGELRGQLNQRLRFALLKGSNEVPPAVSAASGVGFLAVSPTNLQLSGFIKTAGLNSPVRSVILHNGAAGINGTSVVILTNSGNGIWSIPPNTTISPAQVTSFNNSELYFNVRTQTFPGGELRGQLQTPTIKIGTAQLTADATLPAPSQTTTGDGTLAWNSVTEQLSGSVTTINVAGTAASIQSGQSSATARDLIHLSSSSPVTVTPVPGISYALDIQPIFTARCLGGACHSTAGFAPMSLEAGVSYPFVRLLLVPGNSAASYIFQRLTVNSTSFPQMPLNRTPLDSTELGLIQNWINKGAVNN